LDLADFMKRNMASVFVNEAQGNPLQPDIQYRGFVGSPLLGLPQGLAVYQDGVRINEPFGDTVNWALIPESAIDTVYLMPGSNPLFGLNALGGAISIRTKTGFSSPGTRAELTAGSFGRVGLQAETGGATDDGLSYFVTASYFDEDGWRHFSPSEATQLFANLGSETDTSSFDVSFTYADTDLIGNGASPLDLLELDREAIFTRPDQTQNELTLVNFRASHAFSETMTLTGNIYVRGSDVSTLNGDDSDFEECEDDPGFICEEEDDEEEIVLDENGDPIPADDDVEGATVNRTNTEQDGAGFNVQAGWSGDLGGRENQLIVGLAYDRSDIEFDASTELGALDETRLAVPGGFFVGESFTRLDAQTKNTGIYLSNTVSLSDAVALTVSGRYNRTEVSLADRIGEDLNGDHEFHRFNPAVGLTYAPNPRVTLYASYSESNRAPSPVELTCADEDDPCRLPNAFVADPPLEQVVAETIEAGARGRWDGGDWHVGVFRTTNDDDILFISAGALTNEGFFDNVGQTRRDGMELNLGGEASDRLSWFVNYTYIDATFRTDFAVPSPNNPQAIDREIVVEAGDRLPLIPDQLLKTGFRIAATPKLSFGADVFASSGQHFRGDEGNDVEAIDGYALLSLRGEYRINDHARLFLNVDNVLDEEYETFGVFGEADEVLGDDFEDPSFLGPGAPRAAWFGVRVEF
ncbi:MAG TPA: TonB-dependent receptor, partial [Gammaproteobacteria bacterium]|nr:TonB-dependent receptor [Gammaproteobacteria bacterium]